MGLKSFGKAAGKMTLNGSRKTLGVFGLGGAGIMVGGTYNWLHKKTVSALSPGTVGYGKRGIDGNNLNTDGLVQGLSNKRRAK